MKADQTLLNKLIGITRQLDELSENPAEHDLDADAIADINLARKSLDTLVNRVERLLE